ncbi:MAG: hypothetical protein FJ090_15495 [Deltaproteobacteria bacterium]|nr:hypothetical protein [Deltaproteobacteria bacterium]
MLLLLSLACTAPSIVPSPSHAGGASTAEDSRGDKYVPEAPPEGCGCKSGVAPSGVVAPALVLFAIATSRRRPQLARGTFDR